MAQSGFAVTGLDSSRPMLHEACRLGAADYLLGDALSLPLANQSYDVAALTGLYPGMSHNIISN
jgi:ubiquinone/menaquinone biosynthesis C-methylase UbiE